MWTNKSHFERRLLVRGFVEIGSGFFSQVYAKPGSNKVIKIGPADDAWPAYIGWAKTKGYLGTFAPDVTSFRVFHPKHADAFYVAVIERLGANIREQAHRLPSSKLVKTHDVLMGGTGYETPTKAPNIVGEAPDWVGFIENLHAFKREHADVLRWDAHKGNWMVSANGERLVLNDPFTATYNKESAKTVTKLSDNVSSVFARRRGLTSDQSVHI